MPLDFRKFVRKNSVTLTVSYLFEFISRKENWRSIPHTVLCTVRGQALFRSYGRLFAEFLDEESLVHLGLLDLSTCVGLRYG